jgi:hypothetical protein
VDRAEIFIFLASASSIRPGSYSLTELSFAEAKWRNASSYVLPVLLGGFDAGTLPAYLRPITALSAKGNLEAEVVAWIENRASGSGGGDVATPSDQLRSWARTAKPPLGGGRSGIPRSSFGSIVGGVIFIAFGAGSASRFSKMPTAPGFPAPDFMNLFFAAPMVIGGFLILYGVIKAVRGSMASAKPVAAVVLERVHSKNAYRIHLELNGGERVELEPVSKAARSVYPGDMGWAYVSGSMLIDFVPRKSDSSFSTQRQ